MSIEKPSKQVIERAAEILRAGGLVAFPTETVYGLGANALDAEAVAKIFAAKRRPADNPLILHVSSISECEKYAELTPAAEVLMQQFWPGPLTIVLYSYELVPLIARANLDTVALRAPVDPVARELIRVCGFPIAAPSANRSGRPSPTTAEAVCEDFCEPGNMLDLIIDGGPTAIGLESTVVDATGDRVAILRPGGVTREMLAHYVDLIVDEAETAAYRSPGNRHRHYAPRIPLFLRDREEKGDAVFERVRGIRWCYMGMSEPPAGIDPPAEAILFDSLAAYAGNLFATMRRLETSGAELIVAELPVDGGLGAALRNRLRKAAGGERFTESDQGGARCTTS